MKCPACNGEIGRFELSPNCKHCGVNIFYSQQKDLLAHDAKKCELEYAGFRILVAKLKAAFIKGAIPILRIVAMLLAIGAIFVPFATVSTNVSLFSSQISFGAWGIYSAFSDGTFGALLNLIEYMPTQVAVCFALLGLIVVIFLVGFAVFVCLLLSFINITKTAKIMRGLSVVGMALCLGACGLSIYVPYAMGKGGFLQGSTGFGAFACVLVFVMIFVLNHLVIKKNIQPEIKEVDIKRVELNKKVKAGEVSIDDLPLPVFETEEERKARLEKEAESKALVEKAKGGEALE